MLDIIKCGKTTKAFWNILKNKQLPSTVQLQTKCSNTRLLENVFSGLFICKVSEYIFKKNDFNDAIFYRCRGIHPSWSIIKMRLYKTFRHHENFKSDRQSVSEVKWIYLTSRDADPQPGSGQPATAPQTRSQKFW